MTVKKAIKMIDWWINQKKDAMKQLGIDMKYHSNSKSSDITQTIFEIESTAISNLERIKDELNPKCKHPKKMRDLTSDGQRYCMNCNTDL
ncbi:hypothetical protein C6988_09655 [Nitrosopumilus sp. b1]|uniref:hypothetical protein n=1 Tax=Nitrosopumilus sp. b1 TaxID=2109907 RepID=UPI0015F5089B|nr:hypothetical protein [Nitrosopumilus sp. b1]KAF6242175.1 hypothetical protein C6988_09655 [Nitrosopumilus sp. b1]